MIKTFAFGRYNIKNNDQVMAAILAIIIQSMKLNVIMMLIVIMFLLYAEIRLIWQTTKLIQITHLIIIQRLSLMTFLITTRQLTKWMEAVRFNNVKLENLAVERMLIRLKSHQIWEHHQKSKSQPNKMLSMVTKLRSVSIVCTMEGILMERLQLNKERIVQASF